MRNLITIVFVSILVGCSASAPGPVTVTEIECRLNSDCDTGSYCDPFANLCGWDCRYDVECEPGMFCDTINGRCQREEPLPPPPDMSAVLEITPGPTEDLTVRGGTADAEFVRIALRNRSSRTIEAPSVLTTFDPLTGFSLEGVLGEVKIRNERNRIIVMGPIDLTGALIRLENVFSDVLVIPPGEEMILAVRADVHTNRTEFDLVIGTPSGALLSGLRYLDTGEAVPMDRVTNNVSVVRHINVLPEEFTSPPTDVGMVSVSMPESGTVAIIDGTTGVESCVAHIDLSNAMGRPVNFGDLRISVSQSSGGPWAADGMVPLGAMDVRDASGTWLTTIPSETFCATDGCTFTYSGITLDAGESTRLSFCVVVNGPDQHLHFEIGNTVMFQHITSMPGEDVPPENIDGNFAGSLAIVSR